MAKRKTNNNGVWKVMAAIVIVLFVIGITRLSISANDVTNDTGNLEMVKVPANIGCEIIDYEGFTVYFNQEWHIPVCCVHELTAEETDGQIPREKYFSQDESVTGCATLDDYKYSGYDRGHMVPAGDMKWSTKAMHDCFYLTNMVPQNGALNSGAWNKLEQKLRDWAKRDESLVIVTGVVVSDEDKEITIGESNVVVPGMLYKAVLAPKAVPMRAIGFLYPNKKAQGSLTQHVVSIDEIEELSGLDLFSSLPDDVEDVIEATADFKQWNSIKKKN